MIQQPLIPLEIDPDECIEARNSNSDRRVMVRYRGVKMQLAKAMKIHYYGSPTDESLHALHNCDNKYCINPHHIRWGTNKQNQLDRTDFLLSNEDVRQIRISDETPVALATKYGVTANHVREIQTGKARQTAPGPIRKPRPYTKKGVSKTP